MKNTNEIIMTNMGLIDDFITEEFHRVEFTSLSQKDKEVHTRGIVKEVMKHICNNPGELFAMPVDKFARDEFYENQNKDWLEETSSDDKSTSSTEVPVAIPVKRKTRPINPLRHRADGTYNSHSLDPNYNSNYYKEKVQGLTVVCPCCSLELLKSNFSKHKKSMRCKYLGMMAIASKPSSNK